MDSGHKGKGAFDARLMADQKAALDFYYLAVGRITGVAKELVARYCGKPVEHSYFSGCSAGGREGMILSQRYTKLFDGIIVGDPAMRTGFSNLEWRISARSLAKLRQKMRPARRIAQSCSAIPTSS
jgi:feruloyl esterase